MKRSLLGASAALCALTHFPVLPAFGQDNLMEVSTPQSTVTGQVTVPWSSTYTGGYLQGQLVTFNSGFYMSLVSYNTTTPESSSWQGLAERSAIRTLSPAHQPSTP